MPNWTEIYDSLRQNPAAGGGTAHRDAYHNANLDIAKETLEGSAAFAGGQLRACLCAVVNLPAVRAVWFMMDAARGSGRGVYENRYTHAARVGARLPPNSARERIDEALAGIASWNQLSRTNGHYAAMELNGTGVRYYGDVCLVLKDATVDADTLVLERNSYEVRVPPASRSGRDLTEILQDWSGTWSGDAVLMAAHKVMDGRSFGDRRMTAGTVSDLVVEDEDYLEVVLHHGFEPKDLAEVRVTAEEAAAEALIGDRTRVGPAPTAAQALWRFRRRVAATLARGRGLQVRVVTTTGRAR